MDDNMQHMQECLYYLNTFANHLMVVKFYVLHGFLSKAVQYCLDKVSMSMLLL